MSWCYRLVIILLISVTCLLFLVRVDESSTGPGVTGDLAPMAAKAGHGSALAQGPEGGQGVLAFLPAWSLPYLHSGMELHFRFDDRAGPEHAAILRRVDPVAVQPFSLQRELGPVLGEDLNLRTPVVRVWAEFRRGASQRSLLLQERVGRARVVIGTPRLVALLFSPSPRAS